ncbi:MAG: DUF484 family protein [Pseudomonadota bacterium]
MNSAVRELNRLRAQVRDMLEQASENEAILHRSQQRELMLLAAENLPELFDRLGAGLRESFAAQRVSLVLCDPEHEIRHLLLHMGSATFDGKDLRFADSLELLAPQIAAIGRPWTGRYRGASHGELFSGDPKPESLAIIPLLRAGRSLGCVAIGSEDETRFSHRQATDFLAHLGMIASFALENTVNRARLTRSGYTDVLTGWHNRRSLQERLREELIRSQREHKPLSCLMLDLDHFKRVNDTYGHLSGDAVLTELVHRIEEQIRATDIAARFGGEEFVLLLPATTGAEAMPIAERIREAVAEPAFKLPDGQMLDVTVSIGIASVQTDTETTDFKTLGDSLIASADVQLYRSKAEGRNCVSRA